jgi:hypothetical protein
MVKSKKMLGLAMLVIIPLAASVGQGSMCYVDVSVGSLAVPGDLVDIYSYSYGYAEDGLGNSSVASDPRMPQACCPKPGRRLSRTQDTPAQRSLHPCRAT